MKICNVCGVELPDEALTCTTCGATFEEVAETAEAVEAAEVVETAEVAEEAPKADFWTKCGNFVAKIPLLGKVKWFQTKTGLLVSVIAIVCVIAILFSSVVGILLINSTPRAIAKDYIKTSIRGDRKEAFTMEAGKMKQYFEKETIGEQKEDLFEYMEERCESEGIRANVNTFGQYYRAYQKLNKHNMREEYGFLYTVKVEVVDVEKMTETRLENLRIRYSRESYAGYINPNRIRKGKTVELRITVKGIEETETDTVTVSMIKYKGRWRVAA